MKMRKWRRGRGHQEQVALYTWTTFWTLMLRLTVDSAWRTSTRSSVTWTASSPNRSACRWDEGGGGGSDLVKFQMSFKLKEENKIRIFVWEADQLIVWPLTFNCFQQLFIATRMSSRAKLSVHQRNFRFDLKIICLFQFKMLFNLLHHVYFQSERWKNGWMDIF